MTPVQLLARLVGVESTSHLPTTAIEAVILEAVDHPGVRVQRLDSGSGKSNLVLTTGPHSEHGEGLTLSGHMDCVPALEPDWESDPFTLTVRDGKAFGRGSCDMKGFDAIALTLLREAAERGVREPLAVIITCDEEIGVQGAPQLLRQLSPSVGLPVRTIVGEPTDFLPVRGHKGVMCYRMIVAGREAHTSRPMDGHNAITDAGRLLAALEVERHEMAQLSAGDATLFADVPGATLTVSGISGGTAINITPGSCAIEVGVRPLPDQRFGDITASLSRAVERAGLVPHTARAGSPAPSPSPSPGALPVGHCSIELLSHAEGYSLPPDNAWVRQMCRACGVTHATGAPYATDAGALNRLGLQCIIWGPGHINRAHRANEWIGL
ncbi:MAG: M20/M25/M40 family metallo-hydrolase, partial [Planctomycetota bacterium]|nr:M20/M25/M40 family metallo-hydrolase [Planctomycetota bacterium]